MLLIEKQDQRKNIEIAISQVPANFPKDMEIDPYGPAWAELMKKAEKEINQNYTIIYRDTNGDLNEAWHYLSPMNLEYIKNKYKHQKKEILIFEPMTMDFGRRLASMTGSSK
jgi:hypothetical protein